ncbi:MAG: PD40 domain-containing protein [Saprospiraceae bacterium]|nr:PD40 domain-containing protein [Saprospiraceae bacterium]
MKHILLLIVCMLTVGSVSSQTKKQYLKAAEKNLAAKDYKSAMVNYQIASEFDPGDPDILFNIAEAARKFHAYTKAEQYYALLQLSDKKNDPKYKDALFQLAEVQTIQGKYSEAQDNYNLFLSNNDGTDNPNVAIARQRLESLQWAMKNVADSVEFYKIEQLGSDVNTPYNDFAPYEKSDSFFYASNRYTNPDNQWLVGKTLLKDESKNDALGNDFNQDTKHNVNMTYTPDGKRVYYSNCSNLNFSEIRCELYYRDVKEDGTFGPPVRVPEPVNMQGYTTTQPSVGYVNGLGKTVLFFVSDRPGGAGKDDIWMSEINGNTFGTPVNLKDINSSESDVTPFFHQSSQILYFSSFGQKGFGGYDIYKTNYESGKWVQPEPEPAPLNSSYNDLYFVLNQSGKTGYFASNRIGSMYLDPSEEACCNDIYKVDVLKVNLLAYVFDASTRDSLPGAKVTLFKKDGNELASQQIDTRSSYLFGLDPGYEYMAVASKPGYYPDTVYFSTKDLKDNSDIVKLFYLKSKSLELDVLTFRKANNQPLNGTTIRIVDTNDPSKEQVIQLTELTNRHLFSIDRGKKYMIIATKKGYAPDTAYINTTDIPDDLNKIEKKLFLGKGNLEDYLPIELFFDNDEPGRRSRAVTTTKTFPETFSSYYNKKWLYRDKYTQPLNGDEKTQAEKIMNNFFENRVKKGNDDLIEFTDALVEVLGRGEEVQIVIQGFTSPLASTSYNEKLGMRRVSSVINYLKTASRGAIAPYLKNGKLKVTQVSFGETKSPADVVSSYSDLRNSVYSVSASKERRVEIVDLNRKK